jgi:2-succinyl-5-enolpyruvyl-6-hydroxy-3-cyclohexene-1-carboxylate synthase
MLGNVDPHVVLDPWGRALSAGGRVTAIQAADPSRLLAQLPAIDRDEAWLAEWRQTADEIEEGGHPSGEDGPAIARAVASALPAGSTLVIGSSSPVRDLDEWANIPEGVQVLGNRGASGIDGFVSTALGVALASEGRTVGLCGDLSFLHDRNGLLTDVAGGRPSLTLVVVDNGGGQLFRRLPVARQPGFERLFLTPSRIDLADVARSHRLDLVEVRNPTGIGAALTREPDGIRLVLVRS